MNYSLSQAVNIVHAAAKSTPGSVNFRAGRIGAFTLRTVHTSWVTAVMLGISDYYSMTGINVEQIVSATGNTIDVPDLRKAWSNSLWRVEGRSPYSVPESSCVGISRKVAFGETVTRISRWEKDYWEMVGDSGMGRKREGTFAPLDTLLQSDRSLEVCLTMKIGTQLSRQSKSDPSWK
jgi:hypothetical protein